MGRRKQMRINKREVSKMKTQKRGGRRWTGKIFMDGMTKIKHSRTKSKLDGNEEQRTKT